jgi:CRP/FNR family transcriptional regulator
VGLRLVSLLLKLAVEFGVTQSKDEIKIEFDLTHQTLADMIGSNRVTVTRKLSLLQQKKLIKIERGAICLLDREALKEMVA